MLIDWFTVAAQALNFLILVWLMKRYLYKPVLDAIDLRETRIAGELKDAATKKAEAKTERELFEHKNEEFDAARAALMTTATDEANAERKRLLDNARQVADDLAKSRMVALSRDAVSLNEEIGVRAQREVFDIARKVLTDLSNSHVEEGICGLFIERLRAMDGANRESLGADMKAASEPVVIRSAFDLPPAQRAAIQSAVNETFAAEAPLRFETASDLIGGIELIANGQKLAWTIAAYVTSLQDGISELVNGPAVPETPKSVLQPLVQSP